MDISQYLFDDILKVNLNMLKSISRNDNQDSEYIYHQAVTRNPTSPAYTEDGDYFEQSAPLYYYNPLPYITGNEHFGQLRKEYTRLTGHITLEPVKGWKTNLMLSSRTNNNVDEVYNTDKYQSNHWAGINGSASKSQSDFKENILELTSEYENIFGKHRISALAGYTRINYMSSGFNASNSEFSTNAYLYNNLANGTFLKDGKASLGSWKNSGGLSGFFGRISYGYADRYNVMVSFRRDQDSKAGENHRWANFPAASASWNIHNEEFMESTREWLSNFKLRAGWGMAGIIPATQNPTPDYHWETSSEMNIGIDMGFFADRLSFSIDLYDKTTNGLLYNYTVVSSSFLNSILANAGAINNKGIELFLTGIPVQTKDFEWVSTLTMSHNSNKLSSLSNDLYKTEDYFDGGLTEDPVSMVTQRTYIGDSVGSFYMLKSTGVSSDGRWLIEDPETGESEPFNSGMRSYDSKYRQYCGSALPKLNLGWTNTFRIFNFDVNMSFIGKYGHKIFNSQRMLHENLNIGLNRYKSAAQPVYGTTLSKSQQPVAVSHYLEDGGYLKLNNLTIGYTFDTKNVKYLEKARIYLTGENLLCLTKYSGLDPELDYSGYSTFGMDYREKYPTLRTFSLGVNIIF